jgi:hypothetical protein
VYETPKLDWIEGELIVGAPAYSSSRNSVPSRRTVTVSARRSQAVGDQMSSVSRLRILKS